MIAAVHHHPFRLEALSEIDVGAQILVRRLAQKGRDLRDVDARQGMQPEMQAMPRTSLRYAPAPRIVEAFHDVGCNIRLCIEVVDLVPGRPGDAVLERDPAAEIDPNSVFECHGSRFPPGLRSAIGGPALLTRGTAKTSRHL